MSEVTKEVLLGDVKIGDTIHITIDGGTVFYVTPIRGRQVEGRFITGLQITCSNTASSSHLPPEKTRACNSVRQNEVWSFGPDGIWRGGLVTKVYHP